jgi:hypothetical protein
MAHSGSGLEESVDLHEAQDICSARRHLMAALDARIVISGGKAALIRLSLEQNVQMKSQRCLEVTTGDTRRIRAHAAKPSTARAQFLGPIGRKCWRTNLRRRKPAGKLVTFMTGIRSFVKAYAFCGKNSAHPFRNHTFNQGNRALFSRVATHVDIGDRVSTKTGRHSQVPNRPIERSASHPNCACRRLEPPSPHMTKQQPNIAYRRINGGSSEFEII